VGKNLYNIDTFWSRERGVRILTKWQTFVAWINWAVCGGLLAYSFTGRDVMEKCFLKLTYYSLTALILVSAFLWLQTLRHEKFSWWAFFKSYGIGLGGSLVLATLIFLSSKPEFRVLSDETNLLSISRSFFYERTPSVVLMLVRNLDHYFFNVYEVLPKRPLLFPYIVHGFHTAFGFHPQNIFVANFFVLAALLFFAFVIARARLTPRAALAGSFLVAAQPIISLTATSGSFDLLAATMLVATILSARYFLKAPSAERFACLAVQLTLLCHTRYESFLYAAIILGSLLAFGQIRRAYLTEHFFLYSILPFFLFPRLWQFILTYGQYESPPGVPAFALEHFTTHFGQLITLHFDFAFKNPYAILVNILGLLSLGVFLFREGRAHLSTWRGQKLQWGIMLFAIFSVYLIITGAFHIGDPEHEVAARYYVIFAVTMAFLPLLGPKHWSQRGETALILTSLLAFILYHPIAIKNQFTHTTLTRRLEIVNSFLFQARKSEQNLLFVSDTPGIFAAHNYGSINFAYLNGEKYDLLQCLGQRVFDEIIVVQEYDGRNGETNNENRLDSELQLEELHKFRVGGGDNPRMARIARVTNPPPQGKGRCPTSN
jgi:hypothetical protein